MHRMLAAALLPIAFFAHAQSPTRADPADPKAAVPTVTYQSPFTDYRRLGDDPQRNWRESNDTVERIGGWRAYAREAAGVREAAREAEQGREQAIQAPGAPTTPRTAPATKPAPHKHH